MNLIEDFANKVQEFMKTMNRISGIVKVEGLEFIHDNFASQGFEQSTGNVNKWKPRKPIEIVKKQKKSKKLNMKKREGRQILIDSGALRRGWDTDTRVSGSRVIFQNSQPYAQVHNEGGKSGKGKGFMMPQRQMIGDSEALDQRINLKVDKLMDSVFNA